MNSKHGKSIKLDKSEAGGRSVNFQLWSSIQHNGLHDSPSSSTSLSLIIGILLLTIRNYKVEKKCV